MGSLAQFEEYVDPLLRAHLSAGNGVGGIGFLKAVKDADYFLHSVILLWLLDCSVAGLKVLRAKEREGVVELRGDADAVASLLFALGDGLELQLVSDPEWDSSETFATGIETARFLLGGGSARDRQ